ncbi:Fic family protein [Flammeovirga pectinis]|uniref:Fic family protein n=1 Tax=Flammeovirga pectinis TaxID=2494373 RepID=A0A3S9P571_9BACT|nr:DUF4172 domain-containing protein [Flammeovirga pectinis]AZQ63308.1 Fic family protein [Flammeovirga pectinis]
MDLGLHFIFPYFVNMEELYKYNHEDWPNFMFDESKVFRQLALVMEAYGFIKGRFKDVNIDARNEVIITALSDEVFANAEIEGQILNKEDIRNSVKKSFGYSHTKKKFISDNNVEVFADAILHADEKLTHESLYKWHKTYFPNGLSDGESIVAGEYTKERMQIRSGNKVIYIAPEVKMIRREMNSFIAWFNTESSIHPFIKSAIAHLWYEIIHPFEDGNGRIGRNLVDKILANSFSDSIRTIGFSSYISRNKGEYYRQLEFNSKGNMDITSFILYFLGAIQGAIELSNQKLDKLLKRDNFWKKYTQVKFNNRQIKVINKMLEDDFEGGMNNRKWSRMTKCSFQTATRDIEYLIGLGILVKSSAGDRNKNFVLK